MNSKTVVVFVCHECGLKFDTGETDFENASRLREACGWGSKLDRYGASVDLCEACSGTRPTKSKRRFGYWR